MSGYCQRHEHVHEAATCGKCLAEERVGAESFECGSCGRVVPILESVRTFVGGTGKIERRCALCAKCPPHPESSAGHRLRLPGSDDVAFWALYRFQPLPDGLACAFCVACDQALYRERAIWRPMSWERLADLWEERQARPGWDNAQHDRHAQ